jgi:hypothetical protein
MAIALLAWPLLVVDCGGGGSDAATGGSSGSAGGAGGTVKPDTGNTGGAQSDIGGVDSAPITGLDTTPTSSLDSAAVTDASVGPDLAWPIETGRPTLDGGSGGVDGGAATLLEWTGWLIDADCVGANPYNHTQNCNLMPTCIASGEGLYVYVAGKVFGSYAEADWLPFDKASQAVAKQINLVLSSPEDPELFLTKYANYIPTIKVTGSLVTSDYPGLAEFGSWPQAIHIRSIEFYGIAGVSRYEVSWPENTVLTQD